MVDGGGDIAGSEDVGMGDRAQAVADGDEPLLIDGKPRLAQPRRRTCRGDPENLVEGVTAAVAQHELCGMDGSDRLAQMQHHAPFGKDASELPAHKAIVRRQDVIGIVEKVKFEPIVPTTAVSEQMP